jgi:hypothetical protein
MNKFTNDIELEYTVMMCRSVRFSYSLDSEKRNEDVLTVPRETELKWMRLWIDVKMRPLSE